jgi:hypothetical protein
VGAALFTFELVTGLVSNQAANSERWPGFFDILRRHPWHGLIGLSSLALASGGVASFVRVRASLRDTRRAEQKWLRGVAAALLSSGELPRANSLDPVEFGVKPARDTGTENTRQSLPPYVLRDIEKDAARYLLSGKLVLLHGPAASGKTRLAIQILKRHLPQYRVLVPRNGASLREIASRVDDLPRLAILLDDFERYLAPGGVDAATVDLLCSRGQAIVCIATIRDEELERFQESFQCPSGDSIDGESPEGRAQQVLRLRAVRLLAVAPRLSQPEIERARRLRDSRISEALTHEAYGFGESIAAGPALLERWRKGESPLFLVGSAIVSLSVDLRRAGLACPLPQHVLTGGAHLNYVPLGWRSRADLPSAELGISWAITPVLGASSCIIPTPRGGYIASDYLLDHIGQPNPEASHDLSPSVWNLAASTAAEMGADECISVGRVARQANRIEVANKAYSHAAERGSI